MIFFFSHKDVPNKVSSSSFIVVVAACDVAEACDVVKACDVVEASRNLTTWGLNSNQPSQLEDRVLLFESVVFLFFFTHMLHLCLLLSLGKHQTSFLGWTRKLIVGVGW